MTETKAFDPEKYVEGSSYEIYLANYKDIGLKLRCIDDRASNSDDRERPIAIPGGGLGLVMDALGAFTILRRKGKHASVEPEEVIAAVERAIGPITFHTDEKSVTNKGLICGGCGHCNGALADPVTYLLSESDAKYFIERGLSDLKEKLNACGEKPTVYVGAHAAKAVMIVEGEKRGLMSVGESGEQVYVYHKDFHELLLKSIARQLQPLMVKHSQDVSEKELATALLESARERLSVTMEKLAATLPRFVVSKKPNLTVTSA